MRERNLKPVNSLALAALLLLVRNFRELAWIVTGFTIGHSFKGKSHIAPVIGVGGRACGNSPGEIAGGDGFCSRTTNAGLPILCQAAGSHETDFAAYTACARTNRARCHFISALKSRFKT